MQVYQAFGIRISSDIKLPFIPLEQSEFVDLRIITVQDDLLSGIEHIAIPEVNDDEELAFVHDENVFSRP